MAKSKGRDRRREARWRRIVREHGRSGLGVREFCRKSKLTETAFYFWRRELLRRDGEPRETEQEQRRPLKRSAGERPAGQAAFVPVTLAQDVVTHADGRIEIELSGGRRVHVTAPVDRRALADVLLAVIEVERAVLLEVPSAVEGEARPC